MDGSIGLAPLDLDESWSERGEHWLTSQPKTRVHVLQRRKLRAPLVLSGYGIHLRINHGALEVRNGFTHYPQRREEWRFFPGDQQRPSRIIVLERAGAITFDVLAWLAEQDIPLVQVDYRGRVVAVVGGTGHAVDPMLMQAQLAAAADPKRKMAVASWLIREKLLRSIQVLEDLMPPSNNRNAAIAQMAEDADKLGRKPAKAIPDLLGIEGRGAKAYFRTWQEMPVTWKGLGRYPIPPEWHRVGPRSSARKRNSNRSASHPVHAMLNYAYAVLEGQVRIELVRAGFDPTVGFLHAIKPERPALVIDLLEPARTIADRAILRFLGERAFAPADFAFTAEGVVRVHPQLARALVKLVDLGADLCPVVDQLAERLG